MTIEEQVRAAAERAETDDGFAESLDSDTAAALRDAGFEELAAEVERERDRIAELGEQLFADEAFRTSVENDPTALTHWGIPEEALEPVLVALGAPDELVERVGGDVQAHGVGGELLSATATVAALGAFAFATQASAATQPDAVRIKGVPTAAAKPDWGRIGSRQDAVRSPVGYRWGGVQDAASKPVGMRWGSRSLCVVASSGGKDTEFVMAPARRTRSRERS